MGTSIHKKFIISGPCSAETESQLIETAKQLAAINRIDALRAGIWKPRTKPGMFEGVGAMALPWLLQAKKETGLPVIIEVATTKHLEAALTYEVDMIWIGARTTVNPFLVQEIANALAGVDIPVFVKNPVNPDLELWSGAIQRFQQAGVRQVSMIHRGFSSYANVEYRNAPMWHLPIEMKRRFPDMMLLCDPSHICGNRKLLQSVSQTSIDLGFDGLMIEAHVDPDNAWSDAKQQITPQELCDMLDRMMWRQGASDQVEFLQALHQLREQINQIDDELLNLLSHRMKIADQIGAYKKENNITILQTKRWNEIFQKAHHKKDLLNLSEDFLNKYLDAIHLESIHHQNKIMNH